ncbi:MAG TPA: DUF1905 domain-containing protein [Candidatus Limnocylindrales bacterium]|jgi:hypothetical protein
MPIDLPDDIELELVESSEDVAARERPPFSPVARASAPIGTAIEIAFAGELWSWRGPAPYHFISVPFEGVRSIQAIAVEVTYGWGMIPAEVTIGQSAWKTALWPKDGGYVIPIKDRYRKAERLELGDVVSVELVVRH